MKTLTNRELDVTKLVVEGKSNKEIANELFLSPHTIKFILEQIYEKLDVRNRVMLAIYYVKYIKKD